LTIQTERLHAAAADADRTDDAAPDGERDAAGAVVALVDDRDVHRDADLVCLLAGGLEDGLRRAERDASERRVQAPRR
jgi:hypothetical protein